MQSCFSSNQNIIHVIAITGDFNKISNNCIHKYEALMKNGEISSSGFKDSIKVNMRGNQRHFLSLQSTEMVLFLSNKWSQNGRTKLRSWVVTYDDCQSLLAWIGHQKAGLRLKNKTVAAPMTPMKNLLYVYVPYQHVLAVINHKLFLETHLPRLYSIVGVP